MDTQLESMCCKHYEELQCKLELVSDCITLHEAFLGNCLNPDVLEVSLYKFLQTNGPIGDEEKMHEYSVLPPIRGGGESRSMKNGGGSPEHSVNSTTRNKRGMATNSNHATKPKQKRTPETGKRFDYDKDEGGVYKAKNPRNETVGAKQEELHPGKVINAPREKSAWIPSGTELNKLPSDEDNPKKSPDEFLNKPKSPGLPPQKTHEGDAGNTRPGTQDKGKDQISTGDAKPEMNDWDDDQINKGNVHSKKPPSDHVDHPVEISEHKNDSGLHNPNSQFAESSSQVTPWETINHKPAGPKGAENDPVTPKQVSPPLPEYN